MNEGEEISLSFFWNLVKPFRLKIIGFAFFGLIWAIFPIIRAYALKEIIDILATKGAQDLKNPIILYFASWFMIEVCLDIRSFIAMKLNPSLKKHILTSFTNNMMHYDDHYYRKQTPAALVSSLKNIYEGASDILYEFEELLFHLMLTISTLIGIFFVSKFFSLMILIWILVWAAFIFYWGKVGYQYSLILSDAKLMLSFHLGDIFANTSTIKTFNSINYEKELTNDYAAKVVEADYNRKKLFFKVWVIQSLFFCVVSILSFVYLLQGFKKGVVTVGSFAMLLGLVQNLYVHLFDVAGDVAELSETIGKIMQSVEQVHNIKHLEAQDFKTEKLEIKSPDIIIDCVKYRYPGSTKKEYDLDVEEIINIPAGSTVALVGPSGGGKSTIFKLLLRLIEPTSGCILLDNKNIAQYSIDSVRSYFALIPQEVGLFHRSIKENIAYGSFDKKEDEILDVAQKTQANKFIENLPQGYETILGTQTGLSGGQQQRIIIARGLLRNAKIFLFDESTSALDAKTEQDVLSGINELTLGCTKFIIAHRLKTVRNADLILVFENGKIVEKGKHEELLANNGLYSSLMSLI